MSDSASLSSGSSMDLRAEEEWSTRRPRSLQARDSVSTRSSCSQEDSAADTPSRESIGAALDKYTIASREGRQAFSTGRLNEAVVEFDQALDIELQTELECLYDNSIGLVSGLVRREVESRLERQHSSTEADARCCKILQQLRDRYEQAAQGVKAKSRDSPQWYLQMGAALVVINEWEKAKAVYTEGLNTCKDRKQLKVALKNLIKIEQMTSYGEIPAEDQPDTSVSPSLLAKRDQQNKEFSTLPLKGHLSPSRARSPRVAKRDRSSSAVGWKLKTGHKRERTSSLTLERDSKASHYLLAVKPNQSPPIMKKETKRLSFNLFNIRRSSAEAMNRSQEEVEEWSSCFEPAGCVVVGQNEFQPSAITHMRRLTSRGGEGEEEQAEEQGGQPEQNKLNMSFTPVNQESLRIEDDDSELDDIED